MKTKAEKISILADLIKRVEGEQYGGEGEIHKLVTEADMFMRNCAGSMYRRKWQKEDLPSIYTLSVPVYQTGEFQRSPEQDNDDAAWHKWTSQQKQLWEYQKQHFCEVLNLYLREIDLYGDDSSDPSNVADPLETLRQRLNELIDDAREACDALESRIEELEMRIDDAQCRADEIESQL